MKYIKLRTYHNYVNRETGEKKSRTFGFRNCSKDIDFGETLRMEHIFHDVKRRNSVLCPDITAEDKIFMEGCPESHEFWTVEYHVEKCNDATKLEGEPDCATPEEIHEFVKFVEVQ